MSEKWTITDELLYGGDYNPDQWLDRPDILEKDIELMQKAHISVVSLGIFAWSSLEPREGEFQFQWMDQIIDRLHKAGIKIFLATPSGARPAWMAEKYPEVLRVSERGDRNLFGDRHNHCYSSPVYRKKVAQINRLLAERYSSHPGVVLWHISNEYSGECHCQLCQVNFRLWLQERYGSLDNLNNAWWSSFWAHTITDWNQIHSPAPQGEQSVHGLSIDWKRFCTHMTVDFMQMEVAALRSVGSHLPVTTNMMMSHEKMFYDPNLDYWKFKDVQTIASWDSYPSWHMPGYGQLTGAGSAAQSKEVDDYRRASEVAFQHDLFRSLHQKPFLLMESTPSKVNWKEISKNKRPGMNHLASLQAIAHGSNSVQYFQWRQGRGGFEKFHGAVLDQSGSEDTTVFKDVEALGVLLKELSPLAKSSYTASVALIYNWENRWGLEYSMGPLNREKKAYLETVKKYYYALWNLGIPMDIVSGEESLAKYAMVVAPMLYMLPSTTARELQSFVKSGGTLVTSYYTGYVNKSDLCFEGGAPGPLQDVLGFSVEDLDALHDEENLELSFRRGNQRAYLVQDYYEVIHPRGAEVLASMRGPFVDNFPGILKNLYGKGLSYHIAGRLEVAAIEDLFSDLLIEQNISGNGALITKKSSKINVQIRRDGGHEYLFLMNFCQDPGYVLLEKPWVDIVQKGASSREWHLTPYGVKVLSL